MRIEKYHAEDMQEAFRLIKADLGSEAVVIQTKKVRLGLLGWFKKPVYEVIAAVDEEVLRPPKLSAAVAAGVRNPGSALRSAEPGVRTASARGRGQASAARSAEPAVGAQAAVPVAPVAGPKPARAQAAAYAASPAEAFRPVSPAQTNGSSVEDSGVQTPVPDVGPRTPDGTGIKLESSDVALLREMKNNMAELKTAMSRLTKQAQFGNIANFSTVLVDVYQRLVDQELSEDLAQDIILKVNNELGSNLVGNAEAVHEYVRRHIQELISVSGPPRLMTGKTKAIFLIGPTGVGKTTTLAKLAANYSLVEHKRVALVTVDTFRIAAVPQLRTYADIIGVPLEVVYTATDLADVLNRFGDRELVLIDTPGGSPRNTKQLEVLKEYLDSVETKDVFLTIASPTRYRDMEEIYKRFSMCRIDGLLFTKIDETDRFGPLVNLLSDTRARLTYLTTGQNVPQDIELADAVKMADLLLSQKAAS
ncbi:MAG TPA: flagellar biosynthesis protein FlhF [Chloroflexota bacterium]|nr:flagellar biosynthesis protein FlhF [Chloroflexota bacterium]